jgi:hypothetical protein
VVWNRGQFILGANYFVGARPQPFQGGFEPQRPFLYKPAEGSLLFDVRVFTYSNSFPAANLDASSVAGDSVSMLYSTNVPHQRVDRVPHGCNDDELLG